MVRWPLCSFTLMRRSISCTHACYQPSSTLNFKGSGFHHHTKKEHNMYVHALYPQYKTNYQGICSVEGLLDLCYEHDWWHVTTYNAINEVMSLVSFHYFRCLLSNHIPYAQVVLLLLLHLPQKEGAGACSHHLNSINHDSYATRAKKK